VTTTIDLATLPSLPLDERRDLPDETAIYFVLAGDTMLYIGQSVNVRQRWAAHHRFAQLNEYGGCRIAWMHVDDARLLDDLEQACRAHFSPILNDTTVPGERNYSLRLAPKLHADMKDIAKEEGRSLHAQIVRVLSEFAAAKRREREREGKTL